MNEAPSDRGVTSRSAREVRPPWMIGVSKVRRVIDGMSATGSRLPATIAPCSSKTMLRELEVP